MKKLFLIASLWLSLYTEAQSKQYLREKTQPILDSLGIDSTEIRIFTIRTYDNKRVLFAETNNPKVESDTLARCLFCAIVADSVDQYISVVIVKYPNQTRDTHTYDVTIPLFSRCEGKGKATLHRRKKYN